MHKNFKGYTTQQVKQAILAHKAWAMVAHPKDDKFKQIVGSNSLKDCHVKVNDVGQVMRDTKSKQKSFWNSLLYYTQYRQRGSPLGPRGLVVAQ